MTSAVAPVTGGTGCRDKIKTLLCKDVTLLQAHQRQPTLGDPLRE
jgi:hypothetical protein